MYLKVSNPVITLEKGCNLKKGNILFVNKSKK